MVSWMQADWSLHLRHSSHESCFTTASCPFPVANESGVLLSLSFKSRLAMPSASSCFTIALCSFSAAHWRGVRPYLSLEFRLTPSPREGAQLLHRARSPRPVIEASYHVCPPAGLPPFAHSRQLKIMVSNLDYPLVLGRGGLSQPEFGRGWGRERG